MERNPKHFLAFVLMFFSRYLTLGLGDFHKDLASNIKYERVAIAAPRGHAKSTYFSFFYPLYLALEHPGTLIFLVSSTSSLAEDWLFKIRSEIDINVELTQHYGAIAGDRWTNVELKFSNGSIIQAKGSGKQLRGFRPDVIICDDLEDDELVLSTERMAKFDDWFWNTLMQTLKGGQGQVVVVGTILHPDAFLGLLLKQGRSSWKTKLYQAIDNDGKVLWPELYSLETLMRIKEEMGEYGFAQEYLNDPTSSALKKFRMEWIKYFDKEPEGCEYYTTVDLAIEIGAKNDYTAIVTCGVDFDDNIYVVDVTNKKMLPKETVDAIFDTYIKWQPAKIGIEKVGFQKLIKQEVETQRRDRKLYPLITDLDSGGRRKFLRIERLQPLFECGRIYIKRHHEELLSQLLRFPSPRAHDDAIDALAYQLDIIRRNTKPVEDINPDCFDAVIEGIRKKQGRKQVWGNHKIRGKRWY